MNADVIVYQDTNFDQDTTVSVIRRPDGMLAIRLFDGIGCDISRFVGVKTMDGSATREAVERARRIVEGKPLPGETFPV